MSGGITKEEGVEYRRLWGLAFPDRVKAAKKRCRQKHKKQYEEYARAYRALHPEIYREAARRQRVKFPERCRIADRVKRARWRKERPDFRVFEGLRGRILTALKGTAKSKKTLELLGCSASDFRIYIESKFDVGMNWNNYGNGNDKWQLDHIIPCALFDLTKPEHQKRCFHFSNYQPMWGLANRIKSNKIATNI